MAVAADGTGVVVVGSLHFDVMVSTPYLPRRGETLIGDAWWWKPGGKGGNQAMAAARHGASTAMVGCLGDDVLGVQLRERLSAAGVGLDDVATLVRGSGMSVALQEADGDYAAVVVSGANRGLRPAHIEAAGERIGAAAVLLLQNEIDLATNVTAATTARAAGTRVVLNAAPARPMQAMAGLVDVLIVNAIEAEQLSGVEVADLAAAQRAVEALRTAGLVVIVTAGGAGIAGVDASGSFSIPGHQVDSPTTHGAGDVFAGALAARLAHDETLRSAARYANAAAALHVGTPEDERDGLGPADVHRLLSSGSSE